jgi:hypothetical protein
VFRLLPCFGVFREDTEAMGDTEVEVMGDTEVEAMAEATTTIEIARVADLGNQKRARAGADALRRATPAA